MVFAAGLNYRYIVGAFLCALPAIYLVVMGAAYRRRRMLDVPRTRGTIRSATASRSFSR